MYKNIKNYYDDIFPQNINQLNFIEMIKMITPDEHILEVGSATGNLTDLLSRKANVIGIDLDEDLIDIAKNKYDLDFRYLNMLDIDKLNMKFDRIVSFGNTLVHLNDENEIDIFFSKVSNSLKKDGLFIVQILNYRKILNERIVDLPIIDNDTIQFIRTYEFLEENIKFNTELIIKENNQKIKGSLMLYPLTEDKIKELLIKNNFTDIEIFYDLKGSKTQKLSLLFKAKKL